MIQYDIIIFYFKNKTSHDIKKTSIFRCASLRYSFFVYFLFSIISACKSVQKRTFLLAYSTRKFQSVYYVCYYERATGSYSRDAWAATEGALHASEVTLFTKFCKLLQEPWTYFSTWHMELSRKILPEINSSIHENLVLAISFVPTLEFQSNFDLAQRVAGRIRVIHAGTSIF